MGEWMNQPMAKNAYAIVTMYIIYYNNCIGLQINAIENETYKLEITVAGLGVESFASATGFPAQSLLNQAWPRHGLCLLLLRLLIR